MKEILGFEPPYVKTNDHICPNCGWDLSIPLKVEDHSGFLGLKITYYFQYTCSKCGLKWRIKKEM